MTAKLTILRDVNFCGVETYTVVAEIGNQERVFTNQADAEDWLRVRATEILGQTLEVVR